MDPLEFDESDVFENTSDNSKESRGRGTLQRETLEACDSEASSVDGEADFGDDPGILELQKKADGGNTGSHMSTTLRVVMEDELFPEMPGVAEDYDDFNPSIMNVGRNGSRRRDYSSSMPVPSAIRMGSSAPMNIPFMGRWKPSDKTDDDIEGEPDHAVTFVPPHQLSQKDEVMFSWTGQSPSMALKKDRLKVRNQILKSTGFLEAGIREVNNLGLQERSRIAPTFGGLSQALSSTSS